MSDEQFHMAVSEANRGLCSSNKRSYRTEESAFVARNNIFKRLDKVEKPYPCPECHRYHLTSQVDKQYDLLYRANTKRKASPTRWKAKKTKRKGWPKP